MATVSGDVNKLTRQHWKTADPIRSIFRRTCELAGVPYFTPHAVRKTLTLLGQQTCINGQQLKAWSQNLGHLDVLTTMLSYGALSDRLQAQIMTMLALGTPKDVVDEIAELLTKRGFEFRDARPG